MTWRPSLLQIFDVLVRVPPLFVMDSILNGTFMVPWIQAEPPSLGANFIVWLLLMILCLTMSLVIFMLPTKHIMDIYSVLLSCVLLWFSYWFNQYYVTSELEDYNKSSDLLDIFLANPKILIFNTKVQIAMALCYNLCHLELPSSQSHPYIHWCSKKLNTGIYLVLLQPIMWRLLVVPSHYLTHLPLVCSLLICLDLVISLVVHIQSVISFCSSTYMATRHLLRTIGFGPVFLERQWMRLNVPTVLRVFWVTRLAYQFTQLTAYVVLLNLEEEKGYFIVQSDVIHITRSALVAGCETFIALLGMTSIVSYITHYIGVIMAAFIGSDNDDDKNMGTVSAILFFILALQTGLTGLDTDKRLVRLYRNFCLLSTAILHFIHSMVNPLLMNLSASRNPSYIRHGRPLAMCTFLIAFPCWFLFYLWSKHSISTWLLAVTAFSVEVVIKVIITLLLYSLFMIDAWRENFWEKLDDYVYYIKSTGNTIEFIFGIFLFGNGAWIMIFESGGTIRAIMMCIHAYFNIWVQAKEGWKVFINRRTAVNKINSLPEATAQQLHTHNDVCAICYQDLISARVTRCNHLFHGVCLRKWLYVQDRCPLCHKLIYKPEGETADSEVDPEQRAPPPQLQVNGLAHDHQD